MMIFVVPLLLYPLMGISFFQVSQFVREKPSRVQVLLENESRDSVEKTLPEAPLLDFSFEKTNPEDAETTARTALENKDADAVLVVTPGTDGDEQSAKIYFSSAHEKSQLAKNRLEQILQRWNKKLGGENLKKLGLDENIMTPVASETTDVAAKSQFQGASFWSKLFPIMLLLWALTGAFYPAVDLCAGEKERGTLETLLCSPATRTEIVVSKLATVMCFSVLSSLLNIVCLGISGYFILRQIPGNTTVTVPWSAALAMVIPLIPASLIFSALSLALASFAKSSKEGQYYLLPLIMATMPLIFVSMASGSELTLGTALLPITGIALILQQLLEGNYATVLQYTPVVLGVTILCCYLSVRFAVRRFNRESILLGDSQKFDLVKWCRSLFVNRKEYPTYAAAILFGLGLLTLKYFAQFAFSATTTFSDIVVSTLIMQLGLLLLPALGFVSVLTSSVVKSLALDVRSLSQAGRTAWNTMLAALAAYLILPSVLRLGALIQTLYPVSDAVANQLNDMQRLANDAPMIVAVLLFAFLPAICEEIAFRGVLLGGLLPRRQTAGRTDYEGIVEAIVVSAVFFGITHGILQQSINATVLGCVLGAIAVRAGSLYPCIAYHFTHNAITTVVTRDVQDFSEIHIPFVSSLPPLVSLLCGVALLFLMLPKPLKPADRLDK